MTSFSSDTRADVPAPTPARFEVLQSPHGLQGYAAGLHQSSVQVRLRISCPGYAEWARLAPWLAGHLHLDPQGENPPGTAPAIHGLLVWHRALQEWGGHPVEEPGRWSEGGGPGAIEGTLTLPCMDHQAGLATLDTLLQLHLWSAPGAPASQLEGNAPALLARLRQFLSQTAPKGFNQLHFLRAAKELDVPWIRLSPEVIQFGQGANARLLSSSLTDRTPALAASTARNKDASAALLRQAGLPVPVHLAVATESEAVKAAQRMGFPLVVKPADTDGGLGVSTFIQDLASIPPAFRKAREHASRILVERHVHGRDYRLHVVEGELIGVLERQPGGVTGNGIDTVQRLVDAQNRIRREAQDDRRFLHPIDPDDEAAAMLRLAGLDWNSVPAAGAFIRLRGAANVASGGVPVVLPAAAVHPDNRRLAVRAAQALRLDIAGVDLLIPDIGQSWRQTTAAICEVNAQPQMHTSMHVPTLQRLLRAGGRIPSAVVLSGPSVTSPGPGLWRHLVSLGCRAGHAAAEGAWSGEELVRPGDGSPWSAARCLLTDPEVEALVLTLDGASEEILQRGWPIDRCGLVVFTGLHHAYGGPAAVLRALAAGALDLAPLSVIADRESVDWLRASPGFPDCASPKVAEPARLEDHEWLAGLMRTGVELPPRQSMP